MLLLSGYIRKLITVSSTIQVVTHIIQLIQKCEQLVADFGLLILSLSSDIIGLVSLSANLKLLLVPYLCIRIGLVIGVMSDSGCCQRLLLQLNLLIYHLLLIWRLLIYIILNIDHILAALVRIIESSRGEIFG